jgi:ABC-type sugar transport system ATPase subunit
MPPPLLELRAVEKSFPGVRALKGLDLALGAGEVLGLAGENGAGKSTLIKLLSGVHLPDRGEILWLGRRVRFESPRQALEAGIAAIHQELAYFPRLSVAENLLLGEPWPRRLWGGIDWRGLHAEAARRLARFDLRLPADRPFAELSAAEKQEVAMARALSRESRLLILDEPTASLSAPEVERFFAHLERLRQAGVALIYVSHRLEEVLRLSDRIAVLRDGELVACHARGEADAGVLVRDMVGRSVAAAARRGRRREDPGPALLELEGASRVGMFHDVSFRLPAGEVLGLAGLVGSGRSELARAIYGLYPLDGGRMRLRGRPWRPREARDSLQAGLAYVPEERKRQALVPAHTLGENLSIGFSDLLSRWGLIPPRREAARLEALLELCAIRATGLSQPAGTLSGGNQQKAVLGRWLARDPEVLILDEPTRGVDVGAKAEIHAIIGGLAARGKAVLLIASDFGELLALSDRVVVLREGRVTAEFEGEALSEETVLRAAAGLAAAGSLAAGGDP